MLPSSLLLQTISAAVKSQMWIHSLQAATTTFSILQALWTPLLLSYLFDKDLSIILDLLQKHKVALPSFSSFITEKRPDLKKNENASLSYIFVFRVFSSFICYPNISTK